MHQIVFKEISAAELSSMSKAEQLKIMSAFQVDENSLKNLSEGGDSPFGVVERDGRKIYRFRLEDYRIYFTVDNEESVVVQRIIHANTLADFLFRAKFRGSEDQKLSRSGSFWHLIDEGENSAIR